MTDLRNLKRFQLRRNLSGNLEDTNPLLKAGEIIIEEDTGKFKIGNGFTLWNDLDHFITKQQILEEVGSGSGSITLPEFSGWFYGDSTITQVLSKIDNYRRQWQISTNMEAGAPWIVFGLFEYPIEWVGWDIESQPFPFTAFLPDNALDGAILLIWNQPTYTNGVYRLPTNSQDNPAELVFDLSYISSQLIGQEIINLDVFDENAFPKRYYLSTISGPLQLVPASADNMLSFAFVSSTNESVSVPPVPNPSTNYAFGKPILCLFAGQDDASQDGFYWVNPTGIRRSNLYNIGSRIGRRIFDVVNGKWWVQNSNLDWTRLENTIDTLDTYTPDDPDKWDSVEPTTKTSALDILADKLVSVRDDLNGVSFTAIQGAVLTNSNLGSDTPLSIGDISLGAFDSINEEWFRIYVPHETENYISGVYSVDEDNKLELISPNIPYKVTLVKIPGETRIFDDFGVNVGDSSFKEMYYFVRAILPNGTSVDGSETIIDNLSIGNYQKYYISDGPNVGLWYTGSDYTTPWARIGVSSSCLVIPLRGEKRGSTYIYTTNNKEYGTANILNSAARTITVWVQNADGSSLTSGIGKAYLPIPKNLHGYSLIDLQLDVIVPSSLGNVVVDINNSAYNTSLLTSQAVIDVGEKSSISSASPSVINYSYNTVTLGESLRIDVVSEGEDVEGLMITFTLIPSNLTPV
jgi:hypothetical protein